MAVERTRDSAVREHEPLSDRSPHDPAGTPLERFIYPAGRTDPLNARALVETFLSSVSANYDRAH